MENESVKRATGMLGELRKIVIRQDELIHQKQMDIEDLQRERDELKREVTKLNIQLASALVNRPDDERRLSPVAVSGVKMVTNKLFLRGSTTRQSSSLRDVDVKSKVHDYEHRASRDLEDVGNRHQIGNTTVGNQDIADHELLSEGDDDVGELRRLSDVTPPNTGTATSHVRRHTVGHRPGDSRLFTSSGRRRRLTQRRVNLPAVNRSSSTWEGAYIFSSDMEVRIREKILLELCKKYGQLDVISKAATVVQTAFRGYKLRKHLSMIKSVPSRQRTQSMASFLLDVTNQHGVPSLLRTSSACSPRGLGVPLDRGRRARSTTPPRSGSSLIEEAPSLLANGHAFVPLAKENSVTIITLRPSVIVESASGSDISSREVTPFDIVGQRVDDTASISSAYSEGMGELPGLSQTSSEMSVDMSDVHLASVQVRRRGDGRTEQDRLWQVGINHFNRKPNKGILFLVSERLLEDSPVAVANFLLTRKGLSKLRTGEYLGDRNDFNVAVLHEIGKLIDLKGLSFVAALRKFQSHFVLPGEAQKIDRIVECFASSFSLSNPGAVSQRRDTVFILAFSTIMLNTDLHNPNVKRRMTMEDFVKNNRGIDDGKNLPKFLLENIYESIKTEALAPAEDHCSQVERIEKQISGLAIKLAAPHRQLVQMNQFSEVLDPFKKQTASAHPRVVYLFNDLLLLVKENSRRSPYKYHVKQCVTLCGLAVKEFQNTNYKFGLTLESTYDNKSLHLCASTGKQREMFVADLQEVLIEVEDMEAERLAEMESLNPSLSRQRPGGMSLTRTDEVIAKRRKSSVSLSPHLARRSASYSENSLDDIHLTASGFQYNMPSLDHHSTDSTSPTTSRRSVSPTLSVGSNMSSGSTGSGSRRSFLGLRKKDKS